MSKILVVDDEVQIRTLLSRMLELEGYEVCQAGDCRTALKQLEFQSPDVVLCDVFLPDGNGVDLVASIKKTAPIVEIILLTAHGNIPDGVQAIKNGAFDYITKGDDNNKIIPLVSRAVEKARMNVRLEKLEKKSLVTFIYVGKPTADLRKKMGSESRIQLNDKFADVAEIQDYITQERTSMKEEDQPFMTVSLKIDKETKMGIVTDIKQALRQAYALKINYSATQRQ